MWWRITEFDLPGSARGSACCCSGNRNKPISRRGLGQDWRTRLALPAQDREDPVGLKIKTDSPTDVRVHSFKKLHQVFYTSILKTLFFSWCVCLIHQSCLTLCNPMAPLTRLLCPWDSPGKNTGMGCHFILHGIFPTQGLNLCLLFCRRILYHWAIWEATHTWLGIQKYLLNYCPFSEILAVGPRFVSFAHW